MATEQRLQRTGPGKGWLRGETANGGVGEPATYASHLFAKLKMSPFMSSFFATSDTSPFADSPTRRFAHSPFHFLSVSSVATSVFHPNGNFGRRMTSPVSLMPHLGNWQ